MKNKILYLHGFLSSPNSVKAQQTKAYLTQHYPELGIVMPQLPNDPAAVKKVLTDILVEHKSELIGVVGSSLGGYFAAWCSYQLNLPAVLINPAAYPYILLEDYFGEHVHPYTQETFVVTSGFNNELKSFEVPLVPVLPLWVLVQTADETLNYQDAVNKYKGCRFTIEEGGDHAFQQYERFLPDIVEYFTRRLDKIS